ncbi:hypothetical protein ACGF0J_30075 [Nonomuraea sp. NPDC047897]|uniref:hypothetical protein n=1 Tax=Nonomuraea sp. NPDC047897 TaxID=3364346 RepID=UPI003716865C
MKRTLALGALVVAAVTFFVVGRTTAAEPIAIRSTGAHYAVTVLVHGRTAEVRLDRGDADTVALSAVMPHMGHAMPEVATRERAPGRFRAEGEVFTMTGAWELSVRLTGPAAEEVLTVKALVTG